MLTALVIVAWAVVTIFMPVAGAFIGVGLLTYRFPAVTIMIAWAIFAAWFYGVL